MLTGVGMVLVVVWVEHYCHYIVEIWVTILFIHFFHGDFS